MSIQTITELPLASLQGLGPRRFGFMRSILLPGSQLSLGDALRRAEELNDRVRRIASACGATVVAQPSDWFGFDPIHIRKRVWNLAWKKILAAWSDAPIDFAQRRSWRHWWRLRRTRPESRRIFGREQHRAQPSERIGVVIGPERVPAVHRQVDTFEHLEEQCGLVAEMAVDRTARDAGR